VIAKFYPQGPKTAKAWQALNTLHAQATGGLVIPKPFGLIDEWNLVLMECVPGSPMKAALEGAATVPTRAEEVTRLAAAAMATLHGMNYPSGEVRTLDQQLQLFRERSAALRFVAPRFADQVNALFDRLDRLVRLVKPNALSCIHGECKPSQFLVGHGRAALVDLDRVCLGDPAIDVGHFMAVLHKEALQGEDRFRNLAALFLAEYERRQRCDGLAERARLFQSVSLVRMAARSFTRAPYAYAGGDPNALPVRLLQEATACLASPLRA